jgi:hypothetical protein
MQMTKFDNVKDKIGFKFPDVCDVGKKAKFYEHITEDVSESVSQKYNFSLLDCFYQKQNQCDINLMTFNNVLFCCRSKISCFKPVGMSRLFQRLATRRYGLGMRTMYDKRDNSQ